LARAAQIFSAQRTTSGGAMTRISPAQLWSVQRDRMRWKRSDDRRAGIRRRARSSRTSTPSSRPTSVQDFYVALKAGSDVSAYLPYIEQVKRVGGYALSD